jgi:hypothetical protein
MLLSAMEITALPEPRCETFKSQDWPAPRGDTQVLVCENAAGSVPPMVMLEIVSGVAPVFVSVAVCVSGKHFRLP